MAERVLSGIVRKDSLVSREEFPKVETCSIWE